jgi:hypothetical protein
VRVVKRAQEGVKGGWSRRPGTRGQSGEQRTVCTHVLLTPEIHRLPFLPLRCPRCARSTEETNKRLGKGRKTAKLRGPVAAFVDRMKLEDLEDGVLDQVDWFAAGDALPDEDAAVGFLAREVGLTPAEVAFFLPSLNEAVALEAEVNAAVS